MSKYDEGVNSLQDKLTAAVRDLLTTGAPVPANAYARAVMESGPADHVVIASLDADTRECSITGTSGPIAGSGEEPISVGTSIAAVASTRLTYALDNKAWQSADFSRENNYSLMVDQLARTAGLRSGCVVPIVVDDTAVAAVCPSSVRTNVDWTEMIAAVQHVEPMLKIGLDLIHDLRRRRILVLHRDPLVALGLARLVEDALDVEILLAAGPHDPRLEVFARSADIVLLEESVKESVFEQTSLATRSIGLTAVPVVLIARHVHDQHSSRTLTHDAAVNELVPLVARAMMIRRSEPVLTVAGHVELTRQEQRLLSELDTGATFRDIGSRMGLRTTTVRSYSRGLFAKLNVHSRGEAVYEGRRRGLI